MTDTTPATEATLEQLETHAKLLEVKLVAFNVVLEHAKDVVIDKVTLEAAAVRVHAHNFYAHIQAVIKQELEQVKGLIAKKKEVVAPVTTPEPTKIMSVAELYVSGLSEQQRLAARNFETANQQSQQNAVSLNAANQQSNV
jgi:hypothetical protein